MLRRKYGLILYVQGYFSTVQYIVCLTSSWYWPFTTLIQYHKNKTSILTPPWKHIKCIYIHWKWKDKKLVQTSQHAMQLYHTGPLWAGSLMALWVIKAWRWKTFITRKLITKSILEGHMLIIIIVQSGFWGAPVPWIIKRFEPNVSLGRTPVGFWRTPVTAG